MSNSDEAIERWRKRQELILEAWKEAGCPARFVHPMTLTAKLNRLEGKMRKTKAVASSKTPSASVKGISRMRAPREVLPEDSRVTMREGKTRIQEGSLRDKVLKALGDARAKTLPLSELERRFKFNVRGVITKLREAGWVVVA